MRWSAGRLSARSKNYLAYSGYGVWALVYQGLLGNVVNLVLIWSLSKWRPKLLWSKESFNYLFGFGGKMLASGLIDATLNPSPL